MKAAGCIVQTRTLSTWAARFYVSVATVVMRRDATGAATVARQAMAALDAAWRKRESLGIALAARAATLRAATGTGQRMAALVAMLATVGMAALEWTT